MADIHPVAGGVQGSSLSQVSADQTTIVGNGTNINPLRAGIGGPTFVADFISGGQQPGPALGVPVVVVSTTPTVGITSVSAGSSGIGSDAHVVGLVVAIDGETVTIQHTGLVILTEDEWDEVTQGSGGLSVADPYFLDVVIGKLTTAPPADPGSSVSQVGIALNSTTILLSTPSVPVEN